MWRFLRLFQHQPSQSTVGTVRTCVGEVSSTIMTSSTSSAAASSSSSSYYCYYVVGKAAVISWATGGKKILEIGYNTVIAICTPFIQHLIAGVSLLYSRSWQAELILSVLSLLVWSILLIVFGSIADARLYEEETRMIEQHRRRRQKYISTMIWTKRIRKSDLNPSRPELVDLTHDTATETRNATMAENKREMSAAASASASIETCDNNKGNARISHPTSRTKQSDNNSIRCICTTTDNDDATSESTNGRDTAASRSSCNGNCCVECDDVADSNDGEGDNHDDKNNSTMFSMCSICLEDFEDGDIVCQSPNCRHIFHEDCMSEWLLRHDDCPCCRSPYLSSTPPPPPTLPTSDTGHTPIAAVTDNYHEQIPPLQSDTPAERPNRNAGNGRIHGYGNFLSASTARPSSSPSPPSSSSNTSPRVIVTYVRPVSASWGVLPPTDVPQHGDEGGHRIVSQHVILDQDQQHDHRRRQQQEQEQLYDAEGQDEQPLPPPFGVVVGGGRYVGTDMFVMEDLPPWLVMAGTVW